VRAQLCDDGRTNRDVGREVTVHYVNMNHVRASGDNGFYLLAKAAEI
jgi:hypothetical protein